MASHAQEKVLTGENGKGDFVYKEGKVGIGTASPVYSLDVLGNSGSTVRFGGSWQSTINLHDGSNNNYIVGNSGNLSLRPSGNESLVIKNSGNVGIGTNNPQVRLEIKSTNTTHAKFIGDYQGIQGIQVERSGGDHIRLVTNYTDYGGGLESSSALRFSVNGNGIENPSFYVKSNGDVGIGTINPDVKLSIEGDVNIGGEGNSMLKVRHINGKNNNTTDQADLYLNYSNEKSVHIGSTSKPSTLFVNGRIGIGTQNLPSDYKLAIVGKMISEEVKIASNTNWPDYVFEEKYQLPTLNEVEHYIKENGHLQHIPNAYSVKTEGFLLGEMNAKLLQKIEELTLYTIEQEKKITSLEYLNSKIEQDHKVLENLLERISSLEQELKSKN